MEFQKAVDTFSDWRWRLNNLYHIIDKSGKRSLFQMNWAQERLFDEMEHMNAILKARQLGFTTFIQIFMLDAVMFNSDLRAGTIAHTLDDAKIIFRDKVKYPYDNLPDQLKAAVPTVSDTSMELMLANNSSIRVGTSLRSGTLQYLHISEYGKICAKFPEKAREVRTGALNTVQAGQVVFIESTAEGQEGHFYDICETAQAKQRLGDKITPLDFMFHFYPWWKCPEYQMDPAGVTIDDNMRKYFEDLEENKGIPLTAEQKAWYVKKAENQLEDMKREYPATPKEAFEASVEGAYYSKQMEKAELERRIGEFPAVEGYPVHTGWDIGYHDSTAIWCFQALPNEIRNVGYIEDNGEYLEYYVDELRKLGEGNGWTYGDDYVPHDIKVHEWASGKIRVEQMADLGRRPVLIPRHALEDGINAVRKFLPRCTFDKAATAGGVKCLKNYQKIWDDTNGTWKSQPRKDSHVHGADAFRSVIMGFKEPRPQETLPTGPLDPRGQVIPNRPRPKVLHEYTYGELADLGTSNNARRV